MNIAATGSGSEAITFNPGSESAPYTLTSNTAANYRNCTAPCMTTMTLANGDQDTLSNAYYDFTNDALYVGGVGGYLHKYSGVFNGTPSTTEATGFPVLLVSGTALTSPIVDGGVGVVMIGSKAGSAFWVTTGGTVSASTAANSACAGTTGVDDNPLVDGSAEREYVFYNDVHISGLIYDDQIVEYNYVALPPSTAIATVNVGNSQRAAGSGSCGETAYFFSGNFDNVYFQSSTDTGNLWVVGDSIGPSILYQVPITNDVMSSTATAVVTLSNSAPYGYGSPVTEFCNNGTSACAVQTATGCTFTTSSTTVTCSGGGFTTGDVGASVTGTNIPAGATIATFVSSTQVKISADPTGNEGSPGITLTVGVTKAGTDYLFFSVYQGLPSPCVNSSGNGCVMSYNITTPSAPTLAGALNEIAPTSSLPLNPTGAIVIDNALASPTGTSNIYFSTRSTTTSCRSGPTGICAVQASQSAP